jgi:fucose 4-O-acetylase-like acetyltransferase
MSSSSVARRSAFLDNAKGVLIAAVVWYHALVVYYDPVLPDGVAGLQTFLLLLVMPGFALLSGYTAAPRLNEQRQDRLLTMLAAFVVFQLLNWGMGIANAKGYALLFANASSGNASSSATTPIPYPIPVFFPTVMGKIPDTKALPVTWFLLALLFWRALTPLFSRLRAPVLTAAVVGMLGLVLDLGFGSQQIVAFLPWYALGLAERNRAGNEYWWRSRSPVTLFPAESLLLSNREKGDEEEATATATTTGAAPSSCARRTALLLVPLLGAILTSLFASMWWRSEYGIGGLVSHAFGCLYGLSAADVPACTSGYSWASRALFYLLSFVVIYCVLRSVPDRPLFIFTKAGRNSFAVYLFHPLVLFNLVTLILVARGVDLATGGKGSIQGDGAPPFQGVLSFVLVTLFGFLTFLVLSLDVWRRCCWVCLSPPLTAAVMLQPAVVARRKTSIQEALLNPTGGSRSGVLHEHEESPR